MHLSKLFAKHKTVCLLCHFPADSFVWHMKRGQTKPGKGFQEASRALYHLTTLSSTSSTLVFYLCCWKETPEKRWIILVWLLCLPAFPCVGAGVGKRRRYPEVYLFIIASQPVLTGYWKTLQVNFWNSDFFWIDYIFWQGSLAGRLVNALEARGEEAGGNVGTVACLVKTSITQPTLGGTSSWLLMMEPAWCSALYCLGQKTPKDHFWILAFFHPVQLFQMAMIPEGGWWRRATGSGRRRR